MKPLADELDPRLEQVDARALIELDGLNSNAVLQRWTWGLDLAGLNGSQNSIDQAGGIGGLLATYDSSGSKAYIYFRDGNGNVGQLIEPTASTASASLVARYEYDAYGNVTSSGGSYAATNRMRFSTKPFDAVTELGYWGYRWYSARLGRWGSRDPLEEDGGWLIFGYLFGDPGNLLDPLGLDGRPCHCSDRYDPNKGPGYPNSEGEYCLNLESGSYCTRCADQLVGSVTVSVQSCCSGAAGYTISVGVFMTWCGEFRLAYDADVRIQDARLAVDGCSKEVRQQARDALAEAYDKWQNAFGKAVRRARRGPGAPPRNFSSPGKTNQRLTGVGRKLSRLGKCCIVVGVAIDAVIIFSVDDEERPAAIAKATGALAGGLALGEAGMWCGACFGPAGAGIGGILGGAIGACGGEWLIDWAIDP